MTTLHREANEPQPNAFHELWYTLVEFIVRAFTHLNGDLDDIIQVGQLWQPVTWLHCLNYRFIILSVFAFFYLSLLVIAIRTRDCIHGFDV